MFFNFLKSKPTLKELIPKGFVDIHSHILPGIDDGAKNIQESLELISRMQALGFSKIIATPHTYEGLYNNSKLTIQNSYDKISDKIGRKKMISYASEYMTDSSLIAKAEQKNLLNLFDNYVLIEFSFINKPRNLNEIIFALKVNGYEPILAHPERYIYLFNNYREFGDFKKRGLLFQMNMLSSTGYYGKDILRLTNKLLNDGFYDFVGSDIHNIHHIERFNNKIKIKNLKKFNSLINNNVNLI